MSHQLIKGMKWWSPSHSYLLMVRLILLETNIAPEKWWLGDDFPFGFGPIFRGKLRFVSCREIVWVMNLMALEFDNHTSYLIIAICWYADLWTDPNDPSDPSNFLVKSDFLSYKNNKPYKDKNKIDKERWNKIPLHQKTQLPISLLKRIVWKSLGIPGYPWPFPVSWSPSLWKKVAQNLDGALREVDVASQVRFFSPPLVDGPVRIGADFGEVWRFGVDEDVRYLLLTQRPEVPTWSLT